MRTLLITVTAALWLAMASPLGAHEPTRDHGEEAEHVHAPVPPDYAAVEAPAHLWTDPALLRRGAEIHAARCAICHGPRGEGDGPDASWPGLKAGSFRDSGMVARMTAAYWYWRVSEGGLVETDRVKGSVMPADKDALTPADRWTVIAYQHAQADHAGPHVASEHPEMQAGPRAHPEPRGVSFASQWTTRDHRWPPRGAWQWAVTR